MHLFTAMSHENTTTTMDCFHSAVPCQSLASHDLVLAAVSCEYHNHAMTPHDWSTVMLTIDSRVVLYNLCFSCWYIQASFQGLHYSFL